MPLSPSLSPLLPPPLPPVPLSPSLSPLLPPSFPPPSSPPVPLSPSLSSSSSPPSSPSSPSSSPSWSPSLSSSVLPPSSSSPWTVGSGVGVEAGSSEIGLMPREWRYLSTGVGSECPAHRTRRYQGDQHRQNDSQGDPCRVFHDRSATSGLSACGRRRGPMAVARSYPDPTASTLLRCIGPFRAGFVGY